MTKSQGKFITLEGGEGVGKTTNVAYIKQYLENQGITVVVTREPGGTALAEKIRGLLLYENAEILTVHAEILLVFAARAQHINHVIQPELAKGHWVLCDRFTDATYAYQGGGRGLSNEAIIWLENFVQADLRPDLTLLLDMPVDLGMARAKNRGGGIDRFESEQTLFFEQVRQNYLQQARRNPNRIKVIKADQALTDVQKSIVENIAPLLK